MKKIFSLLLILFLSFGALGFIAEALAYEENEPDMEALVSCLEKEGVAVYGNRWSYQIDNLAEDFGGRSVLYPIYVDCAENEERCKNEKKTDSYPEIQIDGEVFRGLWHPIYLAGNTDCMDLKRPDGEKELSGKADTSEFAREENFVVYGHLEKERDSTGKPQEGDYYEIYKLNKEAGEIIRIETLDFEDRFNNAEFWISPSGESIIRTIHPQKAGERQDPQKMEVLHFDKRDGPVEIFRTENSNMGQITWSEDESVIAFRQTIGYSAAIDNKFNAIDLEEEKPIFINRYSYRDTDYSYPLYKIDKFDLETEEIKLVEDLSEDYPDETLSLSYFLDDEKVNWQKSTKSLRSEEFGFEVEFLEESNATLGEPTEGRFRLKVRYPGEEWVEPSRVELENDPSDKEDYKKSQYFSPHWEEPVQKITFERGGERFYASCVDYNDIGIIDFCNKTVNSFEVFDSAKERDDLKSILKRLRKLIEILKELQNG